MLYLTLHVVDDSLNHNPIFPFPYSHSYSHIISSIIIILMFFNYHIRCFWVLYMYCYHKNRISGDKKYPYEHCGIWNPTKYSCLFFHLHLQYLTLLSLHTIYDGSYTLVRWQSTILLSSTCTIYYHNNVWIPFTLYVIA